MKKLFSLMLLCAAVVFAGCSKDNDETPENPEPPATGGTESSIVGDYLFSDGTHSATLNAGKTAIGVIFWQDPDKAGKGKAVSLDEGVDLQCCVEEISYGVNSWVDGLANTNAIKSLTDYSDTKYPALAWCVKKGESWYQPAAGELTNELYTAFKVDKTAFNKKLTDAGGTALSAEYYWSSSYAKYNMSPVNFANGYDSEGSSTTDKYRVRAIRAF